GPSRKSISTRQVDDVAFLERLSNRFAHRQHRLVVPPGAGVADLATGGSRELAERHLARAREPRPLAHALALVDGDRLLERRDAQDAVPAHQLDLDLLGLWKPGRQRGGDLERALQVARKTEVDDDRLRVRPADRPD